MSLPLLAAGSIDYRRSGRPILRAAYVDAVAGAVTVLVGRSGAGKTTLFEILVGRCRADEGHVRWEGLWAPRPSLARFARRGLWYHPDRPWLAPGLTAAEHFALAVPDGNRSWRTTAEGLGVTAWLDRRISQLSGGELRLTELALGIVLQPRVAVLDEPFRGLEPRQREHVAFTLRGLAARGAAVLYADHDVEAVRETADRLFSIEEGRTRLVERFRDSPVDEWYHGWPR